MNELIYINTDSSRNSDQKILSLCIGKKYFSFAITSLPANELFCLGHFNIGLAGENILPQFFSKYDILNDQFYRVLVVFDYPESMLVPISSQNNSEILLKTFTGNSFNSEIISETLSDGQIKNVYAVPGTEFSWIKNKFPAFFYNHLFTSLFGSFLKSGDLAKNESDGQILLDFKKDEFSLVALREKQILLAQCYSYSTPEDVVYCLLKVCKHFSLSQNNVRLLISGLIEEHSALFDEISRYFIHIDVRKIPDWENIISTQTDHQSHYFALLNDISRCAL